MKWILKDKVGFQQATQDWFDFKFAEPDNNIQSLLRKFFAVGVGDYTCSKYKDHLDVRFVDGKTLGTQKFENNWETTAHITNPAGEVSFQAFDAVNRIDKGCVMVDGEEDLISLAVILLTPNDTLLLWGNPFDNTTEMLVCDTRNKMKALNVMARYGEWVG